MKMNLSVLAIAGGLLVACAETTGAEVELTSGSEDATAEAPNARVEWRLERMREHLGLTDEQVALVRPIVTQAEARRDEAFALPPEERPAAMDALHAEVRDQLAGVLDEQQLARLEEHFARRGGPGHGRGHGPPDPQRLLARMEHGLGLTAEQVAAVRPIVERSVARFLEIRDMPFEERRTTFESMHQQVRAELAPILSADQLARLEEHFARRGGPGRGFGHGPPDPEELITRMEQGLGLTPEQVQRVRPVVVDAHARHVQVRDMPFEERRAAAQALHAEVRAELAPILTEDQLRRLDEHFARRRGGPRGGRGRGGPGGGGHGPGPGPF